MILSVGGARSAMLGNMGALADDADSADGAIVAGGRVDLAGEMLGKGLRVLLDGPVSSADWLRLGAGRGEIWCGHPDGFNPALVAAAGAMGDGAHGRVQSVHVSGPEPRACIASAGMLLGKIQSVFAPDSNGSTMVLGYGDGAPCVVSGGAGRVRAILEGGEIEADLVSQEARVAGGAVPVEYADPVELETRRFADGGGGLLGAREAASAARAAEAALLSGRTGAPVYLG